MTQHDLAGRVAVVTGASGQLGPVWCDTLLSAGATVVGLDLPSAVERGRGSGAKSGGGSIDVWACDVTDRSQLEEVRDRFARELRPPTILVNNAGIDAPPGSGARCGLEDVPVSAFRDVFEVNTFAALQTMQVFGPGMIAAGGGSIVNIGSLYISVSPDARMYDHFPGEPAFIKPPAYGASKSALLNLTRYFATHWGPVRVRANVLSPGGVLGSQDDEFRRKFCSRVPLGRMAERKDLSGPLLFLATEASSYVTGTELLVDGGYTAW